MILTWLLFSWLLRFSWLAKSPYIRVPTQICFQDDQDDQDNHDDHDDHDDDLGDNDHVGDDGKFGHLEIKHARFAVAGCEVAKHQVLAPEQRQHHHWGKADRQPCCFTYYWI